MKDIYLQKVLGDSYHVIKGSTVLMVGAGGIGCELLKDLILSGFPQIHVIDLDTITLSNLNRQFLFRQTDIDKLKAYTIKDAVQKFNYLHSNITAHHGNIMDSNQFPSTFWSQFTCIYNALDNLEARRYVNRMALLHKIPVMESGTTGFEGYIQPIFPYKTECFECQPKATPQVFPVCTIRSTPLKPIHCITWAKEFLFQQLLGGEFQDTSSEDEINSATDDAQEREALLKEHNELLDLRNLIANDSTDEFFEKLVHKLWVSDIERLLLIDALWTNRDKPTPLISKKPSSEPPSDDQKPWTVEETLKVLYDATESLKRRLSSEKAIEFDKDDEDTLDFVVAASNLRSYVFHIEVLSKFNCKQIAGNIIPAIATTNAIISGFLALEALNFFKTSNEKVSKTADSSMVFISIRPNKYVTPAALEPPRASCGSCSVARGIAKLGKKITLQGVIDALTEKYNYSGDISLIAGKLRLLYDYDFDDNVDKTCTELGIAEGEVLLVQDDEEEVQNLELYIELLDGENEENEIQLPLVHLDQRVVQPEEGSADDEANGHENGAVEGVEFANGQEIIVLDDDLELALEHVRDTSQEDEPATKKQKVVEI